MRRIPLAHARTDGWFEQLGKDSPSFEQLCDVVGAEFVAYSIVAGLRIVSLTVDPRGRQGSNVTFQIGDHGPEQTLSLADFRRRLASAILQDEGGAAPPPLSSAPSREELQAYIGFRWVLLAPIFEITLEELLLPDVGEARVSLHYNGEEEEVGLEELREMLRDRVRQSIRPKQTNAPFSIDLGMIPQADAAVAEGDFDRVARLLGNWPGPLSLLLRTAEGQRLTPEVRAQLAHALGMLGTAYVHQERFDWALEVLRLGIQWGQDGGPVAGDLFRRLGEAHMSRGLHGQAIGMLRRALQLGAKRSDVLPALARCFLARERRLATLLCIEEAKNLGADVGDLADAEARCREALGAPWERFRTFVR